MTKLKLKLGSDDFNFVRCCGIQFCCWRTISTTFATAFVFVRRRTGGDCKMKGTGGVAPENDKAGGVSALRAPVSSEQCEVVSLETAVVNLMEENTGLKEHNAVLSA